MEVSKVSENAGMTALKYSNKCKIGVNAFKKYDLCGKIIKLNTLDINAEEYQAVTVSAGTQC